jgi:hypothetical protein
MLDLAGNKSTICLRSLHQLQLPPIPLFVIDG